MRVIGVAAIVGASNAVPIAAAAQKTVVESFSLIVPPSFPSHNVAAIASTPPARNFHISHRQPAR